MCILLEKYKNLCKNIGELGNKAPGLNENITILPNINHCNTGSAFKS
jgi:hypothetical protein